MCTEWQHRLRPLSHIAFTTSLVRQGPAFRTPDSGAKKLPARTIRVSFVAKRNIDINSKHSFFDVNKRGRSSMSAAAETSAPVIKILVVGDAGVGKTSVIHR
ncbi:unnamed protein product [Laminaria digitata]